MGSVIFISCLSFNARSMLPLVLMKIVFFGAFRAKMIKMAMECISTRPLRKDLLNLQERQRTERRFCEIHQQNVKAERRHEFVATRSELGCGKRGRTRGKSFTFNPLAGEKLTPHPQTPRDLQTAHQSPRAQQLSHLRTSCSSTFPIPASLLIQVLRHSFGKPRSENERRKRNHQATEGGFRNLNRQVVWL